MDERREVLLVARTYRVHDGLLLGAEVRPDAPPRQGRETLLRVDLAADGPVKGALPPELATFALLGPATFVAAFGGMVLARRRYRTAPTALRAANFCARCGAPGGGP